MKTKIITMVGFGLVSALALTSCSDSFLEDKKSYDKVTGDLYNTYEGAELRIDDIYARNLPSANSGASWRYPSSGTADDQSKSTEEYSGFGAFVNPEIELTTEQNNAPEYFLGSFGSVDANSYGLIRLINDAIEGISGSTLTDEQKDKLLGQAYFFRAWRYYNLVKYYGGVPIITEVLDPASSFSSTRSTTKKCIEFICSDLDKAAKMLAASTMNGSGFTGNDYGRVTTGTALALKGRVLLLWASPIFNRSNDRTRWTNAYAQMKEELDSINQCGYHLFSTSSNVNGSDFALQFNQVGRNPEAVFFTLYNTLIGDDLEQNSNWERNVRPSNITGSGIQPSAMLIDMFPMADGKRPATTDTYTKLDASSYAYDREHPFMNRDPRFYRTFAFPGFRWAYSGDDAVLLDEEPNSPVYNNGQDFELWNYGWYTETEKRDNEENGYEYGADNLLSNGKGVYVRKRSDDYDVNSSPLYTFVKNDDGPFARSAQPYIELRYAEVLLNLAEVACGAGDMAYAVDLLKQIRARAGYTAANNYGLQDNLTSDQAACMSAIIYERQIEFAYEGKRFDDMRRWMLYDGGQGKVEGAPSTWTLTGWDGNTCTWLGFKPFNNQQRRDNMEFRVADSFGTGGTTVADDDDPLKKADVVRCAAVDLRSADLTTQLETLKAWYEDNLVRKDFKGDAWSSNKVKLYVNFRPQYYLLGIPRGPQSNMKSAEQTIGWGDYNNGYAPGTFDPLAE